MSFLQKFLAIAAGLGAGYLIITNADSFYKAAQGARSLFAGSIVDITTGGKA